MTIRVSFAAFASLRETFRFSVATMPRQVLRGGYFPRV